MINPVTGGTESEESLRQHLGKLRIARNMYRDLDDEFGGPLNLAESIWHLEKALARKNDMTNQSVTGEFLRRNPQVKWNTGVATWDHYELSEDGSEWIVTTYEVNVTLTSPSNVRSLPADTF